MLDVAHIKKLDLISPFNGAILDVVCVESGIFAIMKVFTEYVNVMNTTCGYNGGKTCT